MQFKKNVLTDLSHNWSRERTNGQIYSSYTERSFPLPGHRQKHFISYS